MPKTRILKKISFVLLDLCLRLLAVAITVGLIGFYIKSGYFLKVGSQISSEFQALLRPAAETIMQPIMPKQTVQQKRQPKTLKECMKNNVADNETVKCMKGF